MSVVIKYIDILPVFNQTPLFWSTAVGIQSKVMLANYKYITSQEEQIFEISMLHSAWARLKSHFAFAAYDKDKIIGCINGVISGDTATIKGLYVLPGYQHMGIGARLLAAVERAASIHVPSMELFAVDGAEKFYKSHKYILAPKTGQHRKSVFGAAHDTVVPVFRCRPEMSTACQHLAARYELNFNADDVNKYHAPMFAYIDNMGQIAGYILGHVPDADNSDIRVNQLCAASGDAGHDVARRLIETMAQMNFR